MARSTPINQPLTLKELHTLSRLLARYAVQVNSDDQTMSSLIGIVIREVNCQIDIQG